MGRTMNELDEYGKKYLVDHMELSEADMGLPVSVLVAQYVMGWHHISDDIPMRTQKERGGFIVDGIPNILRRGSIGEFWQPQYKIMDAWDVIEKLTVDEDRKHPLFFKCNYHWYPANENQMAAYAAFDWKMTGDRNPLYQARASTMPYAICLAALYVAWDSQNG